MVHNFYKNLTGLGKVGNSFKVSARVVKDWGSKMGLFDHRFTAKKLGSLLSPANIESEDLWLNKQIPDTSLLKL